MNLSEHEIADAIYDIRLKQEARRRIAAEDAADLEIPPAIGLAELLARPDDDRPWVVEKLAKSGTVVLLTATRKAGKTTVAINLLRALADDEEFLGEYSCYLPGGRIELLDFELPEDTAKHWLRQAKIRHPERVTYRHLRGRAATFNIIEPSIRAQWAARLIKNKVKVLIADCLTPVIVSLGLDENSEAGQLIGALQALQAEAELVLVVVIAHHGWNADRARGDSKLEGLPDDLWRLLMKTPDDPFSPREFCASGRHAHAPKSVLHFDRDSFTLTADAVARRREAARERLADAAVALIRSQLGGPPWPGSNAAWDRVKGIPDCPPRSAVEAAIRRLKDEELLDFDGE